MSHPINIVFYISTLLILAHCNSIVKRNQPLKCANKVLLEQEDKLVHVLHDSLMRLGSDGVYKHLDILFKDSLQGLYKVGFGLNNGDTFSMFFEKKGMRCGIRCMEKLWLNSQSFFLFNNGFLNFEELDSAIQTAYFEELNSCSNKYIEFTWDSMTKPKTINRTMKKLNQINDSVLYKQSAQLLNKTFCELDSLELIRLKNKGLLKFILTKKLVIPPPPSSLTKD